MPFRADLYKKGSRVRVTQQAPFGKKVLTNVVEGVVERFGQSKTGSWYAHALDDKLWLDQLELRQDNGELVVVNLDRCSMVEVLEEPEGEAV